MDRDIERRHRLSLWRQRALGHVIGVPFLWPLVVGWMLYWRRYRIRDLRGVRRRAQWLLAGARVPVLICPNHLTWIDSLIIQWAIASPGQVLRSYRLFAWNTPERTNFYTRPWLRIGCYLGKCIPIVRGGDRTEQNVTLEKLSFLLRQGELVMVFPEGTRSRTGRIDLDNLADGVGRIVRTTANCRVLCVYLRGDRQDRRSVLPPAGQEFRVDMDLIEPTSDKKGLRATREIVLQVTRKLQDMEQGYFAGR